MAVLLSLGTATAQTQISGGIVSEEDGGPLVGASIMVVGTKSGTVTDVNGRNDFTICRHFVNLLKGVKDDLNGKSHPWEGVFDPRLPMYTTTQTADGDYIGFPIGVSTALGAKARVGCPNWYCLKNKRLILLYH